MGEEAVLVWRDEYPEGFQFPGNSDLPLSRYEDIVAGYEEELAANYRHVTQEKVPEDVVSGFIELYERGENPYSVFDECPDVKDVVFSAVSKRWYRRMLTEESMADNFEGPQKDYVESHVLSALGTRKAAEIAVQEGKDVFHNGGGHHHSSRGESVPNAFNLINDQASGIEYIKRELEDPEILVVDLDLHFGDGTVSIYGDDPQVNHLSMHQWDAYPNGKTSGWMHFTGSGKAEGTVVNVPLPDGVGGSKYNSILEDVLEPLMKKSRPDIVLYQSGTDPHHLDSIGDLNLTLQDLYERDSIVVDQAGDTPLITVTGGGYGERAADGSVNTMAAMSEREIIFNDDELSEEELEETQDAGEVADQRYQELLEADNVDYLSK